MDVIVARQAIFDRQRKVYGYELLFRSDALNNAFDGTEAAAATMQVLSNTLMAIGVEQLLGGSKAFVNFDHRLLLENMHLSLPPGSIVIELLETVLPTQDLVALCQSVREMGYPLALDDFAGQPNFAPLADIADVIKVDLRLSSRAEQERLLQLYRPRGVLMVAEKVETYAEFEWARRAGYDLFQGYFFARPTVVRGRQISTVKATCLQLLREMRHADLDFRHLREIIRKDTSLTYQLLRYVNSALFARREKTGSVSRALAFMGEESIRRWVPLATLPALATNKPSELITLSLVRARFCEQLAELTHMGKPHEAFLLGMFSLLDALIDQPLDEALRSVDLGDEITEALLGIGHDEAFLTRLYRLVGYYEQGNWDQVKQLSQAWDIPLASIGKAYIESTVWAEQVIHSDAASPAIA
jgi:EAL and modified HD-GYP domain-containing signal transduction protein